MIKPTLVVLAAGMGSRYGGLKQVEGMGPHGERLLDYSVYDALQAGFGRVVFVIRRDFEALFREQVSSRFARWIAVDHCFQELNDVPEGFVYNPQRTKPWGTGHAVWSARHLVREPFCVINADDFYGREAYVAMARWLSTPTAHAGALVTYRLANTLSSYGSVSRGLCTVSPNRTLESVVELTKIRRTPQGIEYQAAGGIVRSLQGSEQVSLNFWGFRPDFFDEIAFQLPAFLEQEGQSGTAELYLPAVVDNAIRLGRASYEALPVEARWFGVTYPDDKLEVQHALLQLHDSGAYPHHLFGV